MPKKTVVCLSGWSDGPLPYILQQSPHVPEFDVIMVPLPMPPIGILWLWNPFLLFVLFWVLCVPYFAFNLWQWLILRTVAISGLFRAILFVIVLVGYIMILKQSIKHLIKYSIEEGLRKVSRILSNSKVKIDIIIGFSWGGAILYWMLERGLWQGKSMLLAPTVQTLGHLSGINVPSAAKNLGFHIPFVFHATQDPFCPKSQMQWFRSQKVNLTPVTDGHALCDPQSIVLMSECFTSLLKVKECSTSEDTPTTSVLSSHLVGLLTQSDVKEEVNILARNEDNFKN